jgi:hypothetical protein
MHHAVKAYKDMEATLKSILELGTLLRRVVRFTLLGKQSSVHIGCEAGWLQSWSGYEGKEKNPCPFLELNS